VSPISNARAATSSSQIFQNPQSASSYAAIWWPANMNPKRRPQSASRPNRDMTTMTFSDPRLAMLDGFKVELTAEKQRADIILHRPPFNVIEMAQRDQLRLVFEALDDDVRVRVIVLRAIGDHFSSGGNVKGFLEATPEHVSTLAWNIASPAR